MFSIPASLGLIIASEEIINGLFGYGSFTLTDIEMTSKALNVFWLWCCCICFGKNFC